MRQFKFHILLLVGFVGWRAISDQVAPSCSPCRTLGNCDIAPVTGATAPLPFEPKLNDFQAFAQVDELRRQELGDLSEFSMTTVSGTQAGWNQPSLQESKPPLDDQR